MIKTAAKKFYVFLIFLFLYAPIVTLIVLSFNASRTRAKWGGFTTRWYVSLFRNDAIMNALLNTLTIALIASLTATVIGTIACIAIINMKKKSRAIWMGITNIPMLNADIVTGISLMLLFLSLGLKFGYGTILLSHITFCIPYVILSVMPRMKQFNTSTYEAALDLGAGPVYSTHFTKGAGVDTLSTKIYTEVKKGIKPEMYALSTLIFITVLILLLLINKAPADKKQKA